MTSRISGGLESYEQQLEPARVRFDRSYGVNKLMSEDIAPELLELFLIHYCSLGVALAEPMEGWIRRAGERCTEIGMPDLGEALVRHSKHEAGQHRMMLRDARALVARWNARGGGKLDAQELLLLPRPPGVRRYIDLHESTIAGPTPYGQVAIEYEVEMMSIRFGPPFMGQCVSKLGPNITDCLTFVEDHVELDVGHTQLNLRHLEWLLIQHPDSLATLVACGTAALESYGEYMGDCMRLAEGCLARFSERPRSAAPSV